MKNSILILALASVSAISCGTEKGKEQIQQEPAMNETSNPALEYIDYHSYSKPQEAIVRHLNWEANIDFDQKTLSATATYTIDHIQGVDTIYLDVRNLTINKVNRDDSQEDLVVAIHKKEPFLGDQLAIPITASTKTISIEYLATAEGADALQFLDPIQTAGKKHPFLFTQSQAILARTWLPCQDSPGIRFTYEAEVTVPKELMALMSATNPTEKNENGVYHFKMEQPVPSYLFALAVGDLEYKSLGKNTGVYAEPSVIESAAYEFEDIQSMVDTASALYGPYQWGMYDVIVLPPSFPFGGMENPRLTFATPTIIAGDKSLTALIAHELAHSWSGNLVTNASWEDIWLNEGFTVYFENRIMEEIFGADFANMLALLSYQDLQDEIEWLNSENRSADTRLRVDLKGRNPDDGLTGIPYDKGFFLLKLIEETVGREEWDSFLKTYFNAFKFKVMTTESFLDYLDKELLSKNAEWETTIQPNKWIFEEGLPDNCPKITSTKFETVERELAKWTKGGKASAIQSSEWVTPQWLYFINLINDTLSQRQMSELDGVFGFTESGNSEIKAAWFEKVIPNNYEGLGSSVEDFLIEVGRRKFLTPIYKALLKSEGGLPAAKTIYEKARPNYHTVSSESMDKLLGYK
ncbi:M1 family metallopeptidase [Vicingaceae bacterium]|nr:M1 family metallopeptidase [Vicingaceae bacterium]MDB4082701.1 M1 family metallopeptidase [Vicingaceae bacterium]